MYHAPAQTPYRPPRHARLFELIRQQSHALRIADIATSEPLPSDAAMAEVARRAAASWHSSP